jgi:sphingomyelin phosphodiesterase acid-like 3
MFLSCCAGVRAWLWFRLEIWIQVSAKGAIAMQIVMRRWITGGFVAVVCMAASLAAPAQTVRAKAKRPARIYAATPVTAILMSDIHFDAFRDPSKAERLVDAPESEWNAILQEPDAPDQQEAFTRLQKSCKEAAIDTPYALFQSSLDAMKEKAPDAKFALLSGDLLVHNLACRFKTLLPSRPESDYKAFVAKMTAYVLDQTRLSLKDVTVYAALGNNDSACEDYALDAEDQYLADTRMAAIGWLPGGTKKAAEKKAAYLSYGQRGDYAMTMLAPMRRTRLIVLDDLFQSRRYADCDGNPNPAAVDAQIAWLDKELAGAKRRNERVWVLGHIPAGLDSYTTLLQHKAVCAGELPTVFLSSERMQDVMAKYADVIKLGVFGHTHMDEMRLFGGSVDSGHLTGPEGKVAIKMVPSISPIAAFVSQFVVAKVDTMASQMVDFTVYSASNITGVDAVWSKVYTYGETYQETEFSPKALDRLIEGFEADSNAQDPKTVSYVRHIVGSEKALLLRSLWPRYACVMAHHSAQAYAACYCPASK